MRQFINIVETHGLLVVPDPRIFVTDELVDRILSTGEWTSHSSDGGLSRWIEDMIDEDLLPEGYDDVDPKLLKPHLTKWLRDKRAPYIASHMKNLKANTPLTRAMYVNEKWLEAVKQPASGPLPLGIFWTTGEAHPYHAGEDIRKEAPYEVIAVTTLGEVMIDWKETFESRFDYEHGDEEEEIQLMKGSAIGKVEIIDPKGIVINHPSRTFIA